MVRALNPGYSRIRDLGDLRFQLMIWTMVTLACAAAALWLARSATSIAQQSLEWFVAIGLEALPALIALSIAGLVAGRIHAARYFRTALLVFAVVLPAVALGLTFAVQAQSINADIDAKRAVAHAWVLSRGR